MSDRPAGDLPPPILSAGRDPAVTPEEGSGGVSDGVSACLRVLKAKKRETGPQMVGVMGGWGRRAGWGK